VEEELELLDEDEPDELPALSFLLLLDPESEDDLESLLFVSLLLVSVLFESVLVEEESDDELFELEPERLSFL
jgi:hypothetical protein